MSSTYLRYFCFLLLEILTVLAVAPQALSQTGGVYDLTWNTIDGGGTTSASGGAYNLGGTVGQPDAGAASGGAYALTGGFWGIANLPPPAALQLATAVSRKTHGGAGDFDISLPLSGSPGVECRSTGGNHSLVFSFTNNVTSGSAMVTGGIGTAGTPAFSGNTMTVPLTGVTDVQTITVTLTNVTDQFSQTIPSVQVQMAVLAGDTTGDRNVNSSDVSQTKSRSGQAASASNFRSDVTVDGTINSSDVSSVKSKSGHGL